jgi:hypothetical protein
VRSEIIVALLPRIVPYCHDGQIQQEQFELEKVHTPLLENGLYRRDRTHLEPETPDAYLNPRRPSLGRMREFFPGLRKDRLKEPNYYWPTPSEKTPFVDQYDRAIPQPIYNAPPAELPYEGSELPPPSPKRPTLIAPPPPGVRPYEARD